DGLCSRANCQVHIPKIDKTLRTLTDYRVYAGRREPDFGVVCRAGVPKHVSVEVARGAPGEPHKSFFKVPEVVLGDLCGNAAIAPGAGCGVFAPDVRADLVAADFAQGTDGGVVVAGFDQAQRIQLGITGGRGDYAQHQENNNFAHKNMRLTALLASSCPSEPLLHP